MRSLILVGVGLAASACGGKRSPATAVDPAPRAAAATCPMPDQGSPFDQPGQGILVARFADPSSGAADAKLDAALDAMSKPGRAYRLDCRVDDHAAAERVAERWGAWMVIWRAPRCPARAGAATFCARFTITPPEPPVLSRYRLPWAHRLDLPPRVVGDDPLQAFMPVGHAVRALTAERYDDFTFAHISWRQALAATPEGQPDRGVFAARAAHAANTSNGPGVLRNALADATLAADEAAGRGTVDEAMRLAVLASAHHRLGQAAAAQAAFERALAVARAASGDTRLAQAVILADRALCGSELRFFAESEAWLAEAERLARAAAGDVEVDAPLDADRLSARRPALYAAWLAGQRAHRLRKRGAVDDAIAALGRARAVYARFAPTRTEQITRLDRLRFDIEVEAGRPADAEATARSALATLAEHTPDSPEQIRLGTRLGEALHRQGQSEAAIEATLAAVDAGDRLDAASEDRLAARTQLVALLLAGKRYADVATHASRALDIAKARTFGDKPSRDVARAHAHLGYALAHLGRSVEASAHLDAAAAQFGALGASKDPVAGLVRLGRCEVAAREGKAADMPGCPAADR